MVVLHIWKKLADARTERAYRSRPCPHGLPGGETQQRCDACNAARAKADAKRASEVELAAIRTKWAKAAEELRFQEHSRITGAPLRKLEALRALSPGQFEDAVVLLFRKQGFDAVRTGMSNDFGRDAILKRDGKKLLVQCKRYAEESLIGRPAIQQFLGTIISDGADGGYFVTTSSFSAGAVKCGGANSIELINGE